jgi:hypothetical protein
MLKVSWQLSKLGCGSTYIGHIIYSTCKRSLLMCFKHWSYTVLVSLINLAAGGLGHLGGPIGLQGAPFLNTQIHSSNGIPPPAGRQNAEIIP